MVEQQSSMGNGVHPDFKHVKSEGLWIRSSSCPNWEKEAGLKCFKIVRFKARAQCRDGERPVFDRGKLVEKSSEGSEKNRCRRQQQEKIASLVAELKECSGSKNLVRGMRLHADAVKCGADSNIFVASSLVSMYSKCGRMEDARKVFNHMHKRDAVSWNTLILGYAENGDGETALDLFERMQVEGRISPDSWTLVAALKACSSLAAEEKSQELCREPVKLRALEKGMAIHQEASRNKCDLDRFVASSLVDIYAKCGSMVSARTVFDSMSDKDVALWNALILGYAENEEGDLGLKLLEELTQTGGIRPNARTFVAALKACTALATKEQATELDGKLVKVKALEQGTALHLQAVERRFDSDIFVSNTLIDTYAKCGDMASARAVFDRMLVHDVVSWTTLISGYGEKGEDELAIEFVATMLQNSKGCGPNARTFVAAFKACASLAEKEDGRIVDGKSMKMVSLEKGMSLHVEAVKSGCISDVFASNTLIDLYAKCGALEVGRSVFDRMKLRAPASYNALMLGYIENDEAENALELFDAMNCEPDARTFVAAFKACSSMAAKEQGTETDGKVVKVESLERGMAIHSRAREAGFAADLFLSNTLIDFYAKCGDMDEARRVFQSMQRQDVVSWNIFMLGLVENDQGKLALEIFHEMKSRACCSPDSRTYAAALKACASVGALEAGRSLHQEIRELRMDKSDGLLATSLVDFYGRCGSMAEARQAFDSIKGAAKDVVAWNSLLAGYGRQGGQDCAAQMLEVFSEMRERGVEPVAITFLCLLNACSHAGLIDEAQRLFEEMEPKFGIAPAIEHFHCLIDALGRANRLDEALATAKRMPHEPDSVTWTTILSACRKWKNFEVGRMAFDALRRLDCNEAASYVLMTNTF